MRKVKKRDYPNPPNYPTTNQLESHKWWFNIMVLKPHVVSMRQGAKMASKYTPGNIASLLFEKRFGLGPDNRLVRVKHKTPNGWRWTYVTDIQGMCSILGPDVALPYERFDASTVHMIVPYGAHRPKEPGNATIPNAEHGLECDDLLHADVRLHDSSGALVSGLKPQPIKPYMYAGAPTEQTHICYDCQAAFVDHPLPEHTVEVTEDGDYAKEFALCNSCHEKEAVDLKRIRVLASEAMPIGTAALVSGQQFVPIVGIGTEDCPNKCVVTTCANPAKAPGEMMCSDCEAYIQDQIDSLSRIETAKEERKHKLREARKRTTDKEDDMEIVDSSVQIFSKGEFSIGVVDDQGKFWFPASETAKRLGYKDPDQAIRKNCKGPSARRVKTNAGMREANFIGEADLYRLIMKSKLPAAEKFQDWVVEEVLPSIRKTGSFTAKPVSSLDFLQHQLDMMREQDMKLNRLQDEVKQIAATVPTKQDIKDGYNEAIKDKAKHADMPSHLIDLTGMAKRLGYAVNELVLRDAYDMLGHPRASWLFADKNGDVRPIESFEKDGIGEIELNFIESIKIIGSTELNYIANSHFVRNEGKERRFYIKRDVADNDPKTWAGIIRKYNATKLTSIRQEGDRE